MKETNKNKIVNDLANLSFYLIILILIISPILSEKTIFYLILLDGLIAFIGFMLLITKKENNKGYQNGV